MLLDRRTLDAIAGGEVDLAFRRWRRPTVRAGGRLRTAAGELEIVAVAEIDDADITEDEARRAGHPSAGSLRAALDRRPDGNLYRVEVRLAGPDPRVALRQAVPAGEELGAVVARVRAMGEWAVPTLRLIAEQPATLAADLAARLGREKRPFKASVRRLKELGLTESLPVGYRLSPRGEAVLGALEAGEPASER